MKRFGPLMHRASISLGVALNWISLMVSERANPLYSGQGLPFDITVPESIRSSGGWPLSAFDYPTPPMGPGPEQSTVPFLVNLLIWILVSYGVVYLLRKKWLTERSANILLFCAIASTVIGLLYLLIKFD